MGWRFSARFIITGLPLRGLIYPIFIRNKKKWKKIWEEITEKISKHRNRKNSERHSVEHRYLRLAAWNIR